MKTKLLILLILLFSAATFAQNIYITQGLTAEDQALVKKAKSNIERADRLYSKSQSVYNQYKSLLESSKKSKRNKGEKKTVAGKTTLKQAAFYYDKGYSTLFEIYYNYVSGLKYQLRENQQEAAQLMNNAEKLFNQGQKMLKSVQNYTEKDFKRKVQFKKMFDIVDNGKRNELQAVTTLIQAINIYNNESAQIQKMRQADDQAWQNAVSTNTIDAYQSYLSNFPNGRHVTEARAKIEDLKTQAQNDTLQVTYDQSQTGELIYRIQILADQKPWTDAKIRARIYPQYGMGLPKYSTIINGWYKYYIGEFTSYMDAKNFIKNNLSSVKTKPFVVPFLDGQIIDIKQALQIEASRQ